jgi:hypothetical protein
MPRVGRRERAPALALDDRAAPTASTASATA